MADMEKIQLDYTSNLAKDVLPEILSVVKDGLQDGQLVTYNHLKEWDYVESIDSKGALFFHSFKKELFTNIYGDELSLLGEGYLESYVSLKYLTNRKLREIVVNKDLKLV